jgi:hypothetical protein
MDSAAFGEMQDEELGKQIWEWERKKTQEANADKG